MFMRFFSSFLTALRGAHAEARSFGPSHRYIRSRNTVRD